MKNLLHVTLCVFVWVGFAFMAGRPTTFLQWATIAVLIGIVSNMVLRKKFGKLLVFLSQGASVLCFFIALMFAWVCLQTFHRGNNDDATLGALVIYLLGLPVIVGLGFFILGDRPNLSKRAWR